MMTKRGVVGVVMIITMFLALAWIAPAAAGTIAYSVNYAPTDPPTGDQHLYAIDLTTGLFTDLGKVGGGTGIAFVGSTLYGIQSYPPELWNLTSTPGFKVGDSVRLGDRNGLDYNPVDGQLYNINSTVSWSDPANTMHSYLYLIDMTTGTATQVGSTIDGIVADGLAINQKGEAYATALFNSSNSPQLYQVDLATGILTPVGPLNINGGASGLGFDDSGTLWMITSAMGRGYSSIYTINTTTGAASWVVDTTVTGGTYFTSLAFQPVPLPGTLLLLGTGLLGLAGIRFRKR